MSGRHDATAASASARSSATRPTSEGRILPYLLRGAVPCCDTCGRALEIGEPRVTTFDPKIPKAPWVRCGDCEYRRQRA